MRCLYKSSASVLCLGIWFALSVSGGRAAAGRVEDCWDVTGQTFALYELENNVNDSGPNGFHGVGHSAAWSETSICGSYSYQNPRYTGNYLQLPADVLNDIGSSWAIRTWFQLDGHGYNGQELTLLCHYNTINDHDISIGESPDWEEGCLITNLDSSSNLWVDNLEPGIWYKYELRYTDSDGTARVYIDDVEMDSIYIGYNPVSTKLNLTVGRGLWGNINRPWWGRIDHMEFLTLNDPTQTPVCIHHGDVNQDSSITVADAQLAFLMAIGMYTPTYEQECAADCNGDDNVTAADSQLIFMAALSLGACVDPL